MASGMMANRRGKCGSSDRFPLLGLYNHFRWRMQLRKYKIASCKERFDKPRQCFKKQRHY